MDIVELDDQARIIPADRDTAGAWPDMLEQVWRALVLAVRDYLAKTGFSKVLLGLSGGIDSAVVLALAVDALGADNVHTVMMPSRYTADISLADGPQMADVLGLACTDIHITGLLAAFDQALAPHSISEQPRDGNEC